VGLGEQEKKWGGGWGIGHKYHRSERATKKYKTKKKRKREGGGPKIRKVFLERPEVGVGVVTDKPEGILMNLGVRRKRELEGGGKKGGGGGD